MTIRKQLGIMITIIIFIAIFLNSFISSSYIDNYFGGYVSDQYTNNINSLKTFSKNILMDDSKNEMGIQMELQNFIEDPITSIEIYDRYDNKVIYIEEEMMNMHNSMMNINENDLEKDIITIKNGNLDIGSIVITRKSDIENSQTVKLFKNALMLGTMISGVIVMLISLILTNYVSKKISKDLSETASYAKSLELNEDKNINFSNILEIKWLQTSIKNLSSKLKLQQNARKEKIDQISHETRTPLTILKTHCEAALDGIVDMDNTRLESCINEIENLTYLISNIDEVIMYDSTKKTLNTSNFDVVKETSRIMKGLNLQFENKNIELTYNGLESLDVKMDQVLFSQILYNLLMNAYKFTEINGKVELEINSFDFNKFEMRVKDNGIGIKKSELDSIFNAYYRGGNVNLKEGDGLGLYISNNNAQLMNGKIEVKSDEGLGSEFIVTLAINLN